MPVSASCGFKGFDQDLNNEPNTAQRAGGEHKQASFLTVVWRWIMSSRRGEPTTAARETGATSEPLRPEQRSEQTVKKVGARAMTTKPMNQAGVRPPRRRLPL